MTTTNRLHSLARTLGNAFFSPDVLEPTVANGENVLDPESYRDVSPDRFLRLEKEFVRGKGEVVRSRCFYFIFKLGLNLLPTILVTTSIPTCRYIRANRLVIFRTWNPYPYCRRSFLSFNTHRLNVYFVWKHILTLRPFPPHPHTVFKDQFEP